MTRLTARPLTAEAFAPYGVVFEKAAGLGRIYHDGALASARPAARPSLSLTHTAPVAAAPLVARQLERHAFSSQSFVPLDVARYLVIVAPRRGDGRPDEGALCAFVATGAQGVTYAMNTWHHPLTVLDRPARFAIFMWLDGTRGDEEFTDLARPVEVGF